MREKVLHSIFIDLHKSYNALDRDICMDILVGYGLGIRTLYILWAYWDRLHMAAKSWGHCRTVFQSHLRVTQGEPLSPTIFNVVVDTDIRHWVTLVGGRGRETPVRA